jgi:UDP-N-acetylglucosamine 2-epimerase (non-hydrolysing)
MKKKKIIFIYGTRPEAIKMAPLIKEFRYYEDRFKVEICLTAQHREMLDQVNEFFDIKADYDLNLMEPNQSLSDLTARCLTGLQSVLIDSKPDLVFVQGDTTTVLAGALAAFYGKIPIAHLEAGLRSGNKYSPYPEEMNRKIASQLSDYHFAPTQAAADNLKNEGIVKNVYLVGNTVIDALHLGLSLIRSNGEDKYLRFFSFLDQSKKIILVTGHRRESFGEGFDNICLAIKEIAIQYKDIQIVYPVHLNPNVRKPVYNLLAGLPNIFLIDPLDYPYMIWLMNKTYFVLTDSGGIQEEAPALGKPVLVMRDVTERQEGISAGTALLVGTKKETIVHRMEQLLDDKTLYNKMNKAINPYGDGTASKKIVSILMDNN